MRAARAARLAVGIAEGAPVRAGLKLTTRRCSLGSGQSAAACRLYRVAGLRTRSYLRLHACEHEAT